VVTWLRRVGNVAVICAALAVDLAGWYGNAIPNRLLRTGGELPEGVLPAVVACVFATLLLRNRRPRTIFGIAWAFSLIAGLGMVGYQPFGALLIALHAVARRCLGPTAGVALGLCAAPLVVNAYNTAYGLHNGGFLVACATWALVAVSVWGFGRLGQLTAQRAAEREHVLVEEAAASVRTERLRLARELHDIVAHSVSAMILQAAGTRAIAADQDPRVANSLQAIESTGVQAMRELHRLLGLLRSEDDSVAAMPMEPAASLRDLDHLVETTRACDVDVEVVTDGSVQPLDPSIDHAAYRVLQESLANVIKHAGRGATARIHVVWRPSCLEISVRSTVGAPTASRELSSELGLRGLAERVGLVGGTFTAGPLADGAFRVHAELPIKAEVDA
jgi:signal transduction histidine kinase